MRYILALLCGISLIAQAETFSAKVIVVMDGDTVMVLRDCERVEPEATGTQRRPPCGGGQKLKVRLANIDAPEKDQAFGKQARDSLLEMVDRKQVQIDTQAVDQYGRMIGQISVDGRNVNQEQVKRGMAWEYSHYHSDKTYIALQSEAQQARRGLWAQTSPQAPWQWRRGHVTGEASRLREAPPVAHSNSDQLSPDGLGRRKLHPSTGHATQSNKHGTSSHAVPSVLYDLECCKKRHCAEMTSCDEAYFYLTRCGVKALDRNKDGVPCESLCSGKK